MSMGQRIRQLRQSRGMTQRQLGGTEFSKGFISLVERGHAKPSVETLAVFAKRLGSSIDSLLGAKDALPDQATWAVLALSERALHRGNLVEAGQLLEIAERLARLYPVAEADRELAIQQATVAIEQREFDRAVEILEQARSLSEGADDQWRAGRVQVLLGIVRLRQRDVGAAINSLKAGLQLLKRAHAGRDPARVRGLLALGSALLYQDDIDAAVRSYREAADSDVAQAHAVFQGRALWGLGAAYRKQGAIEKALAALRRAADAFDKAEELSDKARVLHNLGQVCLTDKRPKEAIAYFQQALRVAEQLKLSTLRASTLTELARAYADMDNLVQARKAGEQALAAAREVGDPIEAADVAVILADLTAGPRQSGKAIGLLQEALQTYRSRGLRQKAAETSQRLGKRLMASGDKAKAAEYFALALETTSSIS